MVALKWFLCPPEPIPYNCSACDSLRNPYASLTDS
jgi:hypothetical protein